MPTLSSQLLQLTCLLFLVILLPSTASQDSFEQIEFNSTLSGYNEPGGHSNYLLNIPNTIDGNDYIIITASGTLEGSEPDIYISSGKIAVLNDSADVVCKSFGFTLCHFKLKNFKVTPSELSISVVCYEECAFTIQALAQISSSNLVMPLNSVRYLIFEEASGSSDNSQVILEKVAQLRFDENSFDGKLENLFLELELMNPIQAYSMFNVFFNFFDSIPSRSGCQAYGMNWGAGAGMGALATSKKVMSYRMQGVVTMTVEAHEGAIIAVRAHGWGDVRVFRPYELIGGFTFQLAPDMLLQLVDLNMQWKKQNNSTIDKTNGLISQNSQNLIIGIVPFQGDPNLYIDSRPFNEIPSLSDYKWLSDEIFNDRIVITPQELNNAQSLSVRVNSNDPLSIFTLRAYFPRGRTPLSFDYPEAGSLDPDENIVYSLSLFGEQISQITVILQPREGNPGLFVKRCHVDQKEECQIPESFTNENKPKFVGEPVVFSFQSNPQDCTNDKLDGLTVCYYIIGVINKNESKRAKYTLKASNGSTHKLLRPNETVHDAIEFGKISYYRLDLDNLKYINVTQVSFQLSSVSGQVSMFAAFTETHPNVYNKNKQSFFHSLHLYAEEMGNLNRTIYLGVQADSSFATFNLQANIIKDDSLAFIELQENQPLLVTEDSEKVKAIHFKFFVRKVYGQDIKVRLIIEHIGGFYTMTAGLSPESLDKFSTEDNTLNNMNSNILEFSSNQYHQDKYEQPIYGAIIPRKGSMGSTLQFKITFTTDRVTHQTLSIGVINQITIGNQQKAYFKIPIHSHENLLISKKVASTKGSQSDVDVIVSYDQSNIKPEKGELNTIEINHYSPSIIQETSFKLNCKQIGEFTVENNCFLFLTVIAQVPNTSLFLYAERNAQETILFSDFPNFISFKPGEEKKLYFPVLSAKSFNLFKTSSVYGDTIELCARIVNNLADKKTWPYPLGCKEGTYDIKFSTQQDENFVFNISQATNTADIQKVCNLARYECALAVVLRDTSVKQWSITDTLTLTLQQSQTMLQPSQSIMDSLPLNGVRFYFFECGFETEKCIIKATEFVDASVELSVFSGSNLLAKNEKDKPSIEINKEFKRIHKNKIIDNQFTLAVKNYQGNKEITYSILLTIEHENSTTLVPISAGSPLQIQLSSSEDIRYFLFTNKHPKTSFKIALTQQTQGYTQITVALYNDKLQQEYPLQEFIDQTYDNLLVIDESDLYCNNGSDLCRYIIQLSTKQASGSLFSISVSSVETPNEILLQENIDSQNELEATQKALYRFNTMKKSQLEITVLYGELQMNLVSSVNTQKQIISEGTLIYPNSYAFTVEPLETINQNYIIQFVAKKPSKFVVSFISENTIPLITFDLPLKDQVIEASNHREYAIVKLFCDILKDNLWLLIVFLMQFVPLSKQQNTGDSVINIQLQFYCRKSQENICKTAISEKFLSENKQPIKHTIISSIYENYSHTFSIHLQIFPQDSHNRITMTLSNSQSSQPIDQLTIYVSQNFFLLDFDTPMFFFLDGLTQETTLFGIILPEKQQKILVEISCYKGDVRAMGSYSRDSALNNHYEYSFQDGIRKILEVEVTSSNFYIQMKGLKQNTQGYIKFVAFPSKTELPWSAFKLPEFSRPKIQGLVNAETKTYEKVQIKFESMDCINFTQVHYKVIDQFELNLVTYSLIFAKERQLAYSTDMFFTQIQDDLSSIEVQLPYYDGAKSEEALITKPLLFFNFADQPKCYLNCQPCSSKIVTVPLDNQQFETYTANGQVAVIVRVQVIWKHKLTGVIFTQTFYYSEDKYDPEVLFPVQPAPEENPQTIDLLPILFLAVGGMVLLGGLAYFFFRKYKHTTNILNFELTDVRNVANLATPEQVIQGDQLKHIPFKDEDQDGV